METALKTVPCENCGEPAPENSPGSCQECCPHDDMDAMEGCPDCGAEYDLGAAIDAAEYAMGDR